MNLGIVKLNCILKNFDECNYSSITIIIISTLFLEEKFVWGHGAHTSKKSFQGI
jgi:hypothetical protein